MDIKKELFKLQDREYKEFSSKLTPTVDLEKVIGIRIPVLREFAKKISGTEEARSFMNELPHEYFEENNLHAFLIERTDNYEDCIEELNRFLPFVDNWATCDSLRPKVFKKNTDRLIIAVKKWLCSNDTYTVRFGIEVLMCYYLDENFDEKHLERVSELRSSEYYINMMIAWYFATALAKQWESTIPYLEEKRLSEWVHNKTIGKARESFRITPEKKEYLKTLKIKRKGE